MDQNGQGGGGMPEPEFRRSQAILNLNAYSPSEIQEAIEKVMREFLELKQAIVPTDLV